MVIHSPKPAMVDREAIEANLPLASLGLYTHICLDDKLDESEFMKTHGLSEKEFFELLAPLKEGGFVIIGE